MVLLPAPAGPSMAMTTRRDVLSHYCLSETTCMTLRLPPLSVICSDNLSLVLGGGEHGQLRGGHGGFGLPAVAIQAFLVEVDDLVRRRQAIPASGCAVFLSETDCAITTLDGL